MAAKIYKWSVPYAIGRAHVRLVFKCFYSCIHVEGLENIPKNCPVILAPNHQNALMDALAAIHGLRGVQVFMARADIFKNKTIARMLHFLKIMPVFRMRDGYENLGKNDEIFEQAIEVLREARFLCIMPEGMHSEFHRLRPLVKGIFRLAFKYMDENPRKPAPVIIPVGIDFSNYSSYRSRLVVQYGQPIECAGFYPGYQKNPAIAINQLRDKLSKELKKYMIHIESEKYYEEINFLCKLYRNEMAQKTGLKKSCPTPFKADKFLTEHCNKLDDSVFEQIKSPLQGIRQFLSKTKCKPEYFYHDTSKASAIFQFFALVIGLPIFAAGYIFHIVPVRLPRLITNKVEDLQFHSSIKFALSAFAFPLWYLIFGILFIVVTKSVWISLAFLLGFYLAGELAISYYLQFQKIRSSFLKMRNKNEFALAKKDYVTIKSSLKL